MSNTLNSTSPEPVWAAFVAIDWSDQKHYWKLCPAGDEQYCECGEIKHSPEAVDEWIGLLGRRFEGRPIALCLEQSRGPLIYLLAKYPFLCLYPVHPATSARYRQTFYPSGGKSDPGDTGLLLDLLMRHRDRLRKLEPETPETRELQMLVEDRRGFVDERTRLSNRLTAELKLYFPQVLDWIDNIDSPMGCDLLERWPSLQQLRRQHPGTLRRFFIDHNSRSEQRIRERIDAIHAAKPGVEDPAILSAGTQKVRSLVALLRQLNTVIAEYDEKIERAVATHPETPLFRSLPGAGAALLPRLVVAFGTQRQRFSRAEDLENYCGIAPVTKQSGNSIVVQFRRSCPRFLRQTFHEYALHSLANCAWARAYYDMQSAGQKRHNAIIRSLAFKWVRIMFRCWKSGTPYDESIYLTALRKRGSALSSVLPPGTHAEWQNVSGFSKLILTGT